METIHYSSIPFHVSFHIPNRGSAARNGVLKPAE